MAVAYAQEASPTSQPVAEQSVESANTPLEATIAPTDEASPEVTPEVIPTSTPTDTLVVEPTVVPAPTATASSEAITLGETPTAEPSAELSPTPEPVVEKECLTDQVILDSLNEDWNIDLEKGISETKEKVTLGVKYIFPQENKVTLTFKCLPKDESLRTTLKIEKVKISDLDLPGGTNPYGEYAYDITTGMKNGDFEYEVTLPKPEDQEAKVSYMEDVNAEVKVVDEGKVDQGGDKIKVGGLDHFTIYFVSVSLTTATLNNQTHVDVAPNEIITANLNVATSSYYGSSDDWKSTSWKIGNGAWQCIGDPDYTNSGNHSYSFDIAAPSQPGNYDVSFRAYNSDNCTGSWWSYTETSLHNGITVSQYIAPNPTLSSSCGLDVALVLDNSGSVGSNLGTMKNAFKSFVDSLAGTPTQFSVTYFNDTAHVQQVFSGNSATVKSAIDNVPFAGGSTNWQDGLLKAKLTYDPRPSVPNLVIFSSDGDPNRYFTNISDENNPTGLTGPGNGFDSASHNAAISLANTIKGSGTRVITLGIGGGSNMQSRMVAISSADAYYNAGNFDELSTALNEIVTDLCGGTISVTKLVDGQAASGWDYSVSVTGGTPSPSSGITDGSGKVNFDINPTDGPATASVIETVKSGYQIVSASCSTATHGVGTFDGVDSVDGITVGASDVISCTFNNRQLPTTGTITFVKDAQPDSSQSFHFAYGYNTYPIRDFNLVDDGGDGSETITFTSIPTGAYSWTEDAVTGWSLDGITCDDANSGVSATNPRTVNVNLEGGEHVTCKFTNTWDTGSINVHKFEDMNGDGLQNYGDPDKSGWEMYLYSGSECVSQNIITHQATGTGGLTTFDDLLPGVYSVYDNYFGSDVNVDPAQPTNGLSCRTVTVTGNHAENIDFGNFIRWQVAGTKFVDSDGDGIWDSGESPKSGVRIEYFVFDGEQWVSNGSSITGNDGIYRYQSYDPRPFKVCEVVPSGWTRTMPGDSDCYEINPVSGGNYTERNFGNFELGGAYGCKYEDINGNGTREKESERQLAGWTIRLYNSDWVLEEETLTTTNDSIYGNNYRFDHVMGTGTYYLCEVMQPGWIQTEPGTGIEEGNAVLNASPNYSSEGTYCRRINNSYSGNWWSGQRFGNMETLLGLTLAKSNTVSGLTVTYSLEVENTSNQDLSVTIYDSPPGGFSYVSGSSQYDGSSIGDPADNSGLLSWTVFLAKGEKKTLSYQATISGELKDGVYTNQAYARGVFALLDREYKVTYSRSVETGLVSSEVSIIKGLSYGGTLSTTTSVLGASTGQVLGASTELPGTGNPTMILLIAGLSGILGLSLRRLSKKYEKN